MSGIFLGLAIMGVGGVAIAHRADHEFDAKVRVGRQRSGYDENRHFHITPFAGWSAGLILILIGGVIVYYSAKTLD